MHLKNLDLIVAISIAATNVGWALFPHSHNVIGVILALPLVLVLPGYSLIEAIFPKRPFHASHRLTLSLGLSLTITILSGFILNMLPGGLRPLSWAGFLGLLIGIFSLVAAYSRRTVTLSKSQPFQYRLTTSDYILFGLAALVATQAILYSALGTVYQPYKSFTQFWLLPPIQTEKNCVVHLGMRSFEKSTVTYQITMTMNGVEVSRWSPIILAPQQEWNQKVLLKPGRTGRIGTMHVEARLYRSDKPESEYQKVNLTLLPGKKSPCEGRLQKGEAR